MSINQSTNYAAATGNAFPCEINPSLSIATLAEGLVMDDAKVQFRENLERIYDLWKSMVQKYTLPSTTACNDPCIVKVLHDLAGDFKNADASVSRFASVLSARLMDSLQSRIKSDRRARKVILRKRADSIVTDMYVNALSSLANTAAARPQAFWFRRLHKRRTYLAGSAPLLIVFYTGKAERIMRNLKVSNGNLHAVATEVYRRCPPEVVQAAEYIMQMGESNGGISAEEKQVHIEKLRYMLP